MQYSQKQPRRCRGTTLIEVLAGLIILGTLLVSVSIARARFLNQWAEADQRLRATKSADLLLAAWLAGSILSVPIGSEGALPNMPGYVWRTHLIGNAEAATLGALIIRLEIIDRTSPPPGVSQIGVARDSILSVDFLLHDTTAKVSASNPANHPVTRPAQ